MSDPYEEIIDGEMCLRLPPGARHEQICDRLHARVVAALTGVTTTRLLPTRTSIALVRNNRVRPDLALVTAANNKLWLAAEIINSGDHTPDTVLKKTLYEEISLPRLWMIDPRYDNVEVYHGSPHGLALKQILALNDALTESLLPNFQFKINEMFQQ